MVANRVGGRGRQDAVCRQWPNSEATSNQDADGGRWFQTKSASWAKRHVASGGAVISDGLAYFQSGREANCEHLVVTGAT